MHEPSSTSSASDRRASMAASAAPFAPAGATAGVAAAAYERLVSLPHISLDGLVGIALGVVNVDAALDVGVVTVDLSWLATSPSLDYFGLAVSVRSIVDALAPVLKMPPRAAASAKPTVPPARKQLPDILRRLRVLWSVKAAIGLLCVVLVGDVDRAGIMFIVDTAVASASGVLGGGESSGSETFTEPPSASIASVKLLSFSGFKDIHGITSATPPTPTHVAVGLYRIAVQPQRLDGSSDEAAVLPGSPLAKLAALGLGTVSVTVERLDLDYLFVDFFVAIHACIDVVKIARLFAPPSGGERPAAPSTETANSSSSNSSSNPAGTTNTKRRSGATRRRLGELPMTTGRPLVRVSIGGIHMNAELPDHVLMRITVAATTVEMRPGNLVHAITSTFTADVLVQPDGLYRRIATLADFAIDFAPDAPPTRLQKYISVSASTAHVTVPHGFEMSDIIEGFVNLLRATKSQVSTAFGIMFSTASPEGRTLADESDTPEITLAVGTLHVRIEDDPFAVALERNYRVGLVENAARVSRERLFWRQLKRETLASGGGAGGAGAGGGQTAQERKAWGCCRNTTAAPTWRRLAKPKQQRAGAGAETGTGTAPAIETAAGQVLLVYFLFTGLNVVVTAPTLLSETIEETLHLLDATTPRQLIYDDLIARDLVVEMQSACVRLRDYPYALFDLPAPPASTATATATAASPASRSKTPTWRTSGLLVVAEPALSSESRRLVHIGLGGLKAPPVPVTRSVNPTKIYLQTRTDIMTASTVRACYGTAYDPCLADFSNIIDTFTKPNVDPSPLIGWWDKLRVILHGTNDVKVSGGGELRVRVLGSASPAYDPVKHLGMDGVEMTFGRGVHVQMGSIPSAPDDMVVLEAGEVRWSFPHGQTGGSDYDRRRDDLLAKLTGGVRIAVGVDFLTAVAGEGSAPSVEVKPWKTHADIVLRTPEYCQVRTFGEVWDSFYGFRSSSLHVRVQITSPKPYFSGLSVPANYLCLNSASLNQLQIMASVYQSILTNIPVRTRGLVFKAWDQARHARTTAATAMTAAAAAAAAIKKPKLGRLLSTVRVVTTLQPLVLSFISEYEDLSGGVGARARALRMESDFSLRQHTLKQIRDQGAGDSVERRPVYRWDLEESAMSFSQIEGCTLTYACDPRDLAARSAGASGGLAGGGQASGGSAGTASGGGQSGDADAVPGVEDRDAWLFPEDVYYTPDIASIRLTPFLWSPKLIYFRRNAGSGSEAGQREQDIYHEQLVLLKERLREIEADIWALKEEQRDLEARVQVFFGLQGKTKESAALMDRLTLQYEKRALILGSIKDLTDTLDAGEFARETATDAEQQEDPRVFKHHYVVHNLCFLWMVPVRNAVFKLVDQTAKNFALKYCLSNAASKVVSELVEAVGSQRESERRRNTSAFGGGGGSGGGGTGGSGFGFGPDGSDDAGPKGRSGAGGLGGGPSGMPGPVPVPSFSPAQVNDMVDQLLHDLALGIRINVPNENEAEMGGEPVYVSRSPTPSTATSDMNTRFRKLNRYMASDDVHSPDYLADGQQVESNYIITLINPQVALQVASTTEPGLVQSVVVASTGMELQSVVILDEAAAAARLGYDDKDRNDAIIKYRMVVKLHDAQFFVTQGVDLSAVGSPAGGYGYPSGNGNRSPSSASSGGVVMYGGGGLTSSPVSMSGGRPADTSGSPSSSLWARQHWVPMECFLDTSATDPRLVRIVEHASASFHRDKLNPLYFKRAEMAAAEAAARGAGHAYAASHVLASMSPNGPPSPTSARMPSMPASSSSSSQRQIDQSDSQTLLLPKFSISVNSSQYLLVHNIISSLLVYRDPTAGKRNERLRKMLLALEQLSDLRQIQEMVLSLQERIRFHESHVQSLLSSLPAVATATPSFASPALAFSSPVLSTVGSTADQQQQQQQKVALELLDRCLSLSQGRDELQVIMEALKGLQQLEKNRAKSDGLAFQMRLNVNKLVWLMLLDSGEPLLRWTSTNANFAWTSKDDLSTVNTVEIDTIYVENLQAGGSSGTGGGGGGGGAGGSAGGPVSGSGNSVNTAFSGFRDVISPYVPDRQTVDFRRNKMLRVYWREMAPVAGIQVVDHFEVNMFPLLIQVTYEMGKQVMRYVFPHKKAGGEAAGGVQTRPVTPMPPGEETGRSRTPHGHGSPMPGGLTSEPSQTQMGGVSAAATVGPASGGQLPSLSSQASGMSVDTADSTAAGSGRRVRGYSEDSTVTLMAGKSSDVHRHGGLSLGLTGLSGSAGSAAASITAPTAASASTATGTSHAVVAGSTPATVSTALGQQRNTNELSELRQMQARATENRSFIYIKVPSVMHCVSFRGAKETTNIADLTMFEFTLPTLEYRNKTWTWYDFANALKRDTIKIAFANTGNLVREKLFQKRKINAAAHTQAMFGVAGSGSETGSATGSGSTLASGAAGDESRIVTIDDEETRSLGGVPTIQLDDGSRPAYHNPLQSQSQPQPPPRRRDRRHSGSGGGIIKSILKRKAKKDDDDEGGSGSGGAGGLAHTHLFRATSRDDLGEMSTGPLNLNGADEELHWHGGLGGYGGQPWDQEEDDLKGRQVFGKLYVPRHVQ
ncbi:golgi-body localization protein domain-containing protein [Entophlyctis helioformis]|nr:golgi-body localization protein domain-containing protein [Entophlyctis helioformis]